MRVRTLLLAWPAVLALSSTAGLGQNREDVLRCRAIADDAGRLACYDALALSPVPPRGKYELVSLQDFSEAPLGYRGRLVEVAGRIASGRGGLSLLPGEPTGREIPIEIERLPRQERMSLEQNCTGGCEASVQGRVGPVRFVTGIVADAVLLR